MNRIVQGAEAIATVTALTAAAVVVTVVAPFVSAVAVPIFATKAFLHWNEHRSLYNRTLTNLTREKFGRIPGQDYMRWDGKAINQANINPTLTEKMHEAIGSYIHGSPDNSFTYNRSKEATDSPFRTQEDLEWLKREFTRKEKEDLLDSDLKMLRAFSKALIPIIGVIWILFTELSIGGASQIGCSVCMMGGDVENTHWGWREAIEFHRQSLQNRLINLEISFNCSNT